MSKPVTTIDSRFSDLTAIATEWEDTQHALETSELFWIVTVRANGHPHLTPLVAVWHEGALYFCTGDAEQKVQNLQSNPHVILATGSIQWNSGIDIVVEGDAIQVTYEDLLKRVAQVWTTKWDGRWHYKVHNGAFRSDDATKIPVFAVTPTKVFAYAEGPCFGQTRHQF